MLESYNDTTQTSLTSSNSDTLLVLGSKRPEIRSYATGREDDESLMIYMA